MLIKRVECTALIQCTGVWFAGGKFGVSWKAVQIRLDRVPEGIRGYGFVEDESEMSETKPASASLFKQKPVQEEEEEEEQEEEVIPSQPALVDDDEDEEVTAPAPVPKKTIVTKKKIVTAAKK